MARGNTEVMEDHTEGTESVLDALYEILMPNALRRTFGSWPCMLSIAPGFIPVKLMQCMIWVSRQ